MRKKAIIRELKNTGLDLSKVWVLCGAAMVLHDLRETTSDIDLGCSSKYFYELLRNNYQVKDWDNGDRSIDFSESIEIFEEWNIDQKVVINGIATSSIKDLIEQKESLNRDKDKRDLKLLYEKTKMKVKDDRSPA